MRELHAVLAWVVVVSTGLSGAWITMAHWVDAARHRSMWWAVNVAHLLVGVQVIVGTALVAGRTDEADQTHMFYGFLTFVAVGIIVAYRHLSEYRYLLYGVGTLFIMGLGIRAMTLDGLVG